MKNFLFLVLLFFSIYTVSAQDSVTVKDYQRAQQFLLGNTMQYVDNLFMRPNWINGDSFWYVDESDRKKSYYLVDAKKGKRSTAFDAGKLAAALSATTGKTVKADELPIYQLKFSDDAKSLSFQYENKNWNYVIKTNKLSEEQYIKKEGPSRFNGAVSPDGTMTAFIKNDNLWVRDNASKETFQLTKDGVKDYGYATDNAGWKHSKNPVVLWSPDSKKIATFQQDERNVGDMYLVTTNVGHPKLESWKYPLPGDSIVAMIERVIINVDKNNPEVIRLKIPADYHRATLGDDIMAGGVLADAQWSDDGKTLAFVSNSRDHKVAKFRLANTVTGDVREVFEESVPTQFESGQQSISWKYLPASNEVIWYSERDNYGHLYLYDSRTGQLKNQITTGKFIVSNIENVDEKNRKIYLMAAGLDAGNPYFEHFCSVNFDGKNFKDLSPEEGTHRVTVSPSGKYFFNAWSQPDVPSSFNVRSTDGKKILDIGSTDVSRLKQALGWKPNIPFSVKAADGVTDIYGLMFLPTNMDQSKKYPLVDYIYPGPQGGSVGNWSFMPVKGDLQALAELGFVVIAIEGTCNPMRTKSFHDMCYGNMGTNTLPDQVTGIRQLAGRYDFIDTTRIGIWGHSGGGFATADAMFTYPDFFKVGISESGNHDNRNYEDDWGERYIGLLEKNADGSSNYTHQANQMHAENLKGRLLLVHGLMDDNVPPYNTFLVVKALQDANKDFDLIIFPDSRHGYGKYSSYMMRTRWDYFVTHLKGALHPKEFKIGN